MSGPPENASAVAWIFPGQGSQVVGMGKALYDTLPEVRELFGRANNLLGHSISELCFEGPEESLQQTNNAQPALLVTELAHLSALRARYPGSFDTAAFAAGHSLGEYSALVAAGVLDFDTALQLVAERGRLMAEAGSSLGRPTGMAAILGLADDRLEAVCAEAGVDVANLNAPGQVVVSGPRDALERAAAIAKEEGARRVIPLQVSAAFHSRWMRPMADEFAAFLAQQTFREGWIPVVANVTARPEHAGSFAELLAKQTYSPVRWIESVRFMAENGATTFVEIGPGKVLAGLVRRVAPEARVVASEDLLV